MGYDSFITLGAERISVERKTWFLDHFWYSDILMKAVAILFCPV